MQGLAPIQQGIPTPPNSDFMEAIAIMTRSPSEASRGGPHPTGLNFRPLDGHVLVLPAELHPALKMAGRVELKLAGTSALAFVVGVRLHGQAGGWSIPWHATVYAYRKDKGRGLPIDATQAHQMPASSRRLAVVAADPQGNAVASRRCELTSDFSFALNRRARQAWNTDLRQGQFENTLRALGKIDADEIERLQTFEHLIVGLE